MKFRLFYIVFLLVLVKPASATNFYVGLNAGIMSQSGDFTVLDTSPATGSTVSSLNDYELPDSDDLTYSVYAGYKLARDIFFEVGYAQNTEIEDLAEFRINTLSDPDRAVVESYETKYIYAAFVGVWPVQNNWAFNGRLGFSVWDMDYVHLSADLPAVLPVSSIDDFENVVAASLTDNSSAILLGFGVSYALDKNIEFKFNVESHSFDFSFTNLELDFTGLNYTIGTAYHF